MELFQTIWNWISGNPGTDAGVGIGTTIVSGLFIYWHKTNNTFKEDLRTQQAAFKAGTREEVDLLKGVIGTFRAEYTNIKELADQLQQEREDMQVELMEMRRELDEAKKRDHAKAAVITTLKTEIERLEEETHTQADTMAAMSQQNAEMRQEITALHARVKELTQVSDAQQMRNDRQDAEISDSR